MTQQAAPATTRRRRTPDASLPPPPAVVAAAAWALPGLGYWLVGERGRALVAGPTILILFVLGLLIGGARVVDVPGYTGNGFPVASDPNLSFDQRRQLGSKTWLQLTFDKAWFIPQLMTGPVTIGTGAWSLSLARDGVVRATSRLWDIGTLYTAVAGMLNLFVLIDAAHRAAKLRDADPRM